MDQDKILIIGAGIGGLVLAQGLKHRGIPFQVFERDGSLTAKEQGYRFRCESSGLEALEEAISPEKWDMFEKTHAKDSPAILTLLDPYTAEKTQQWLVSDGPTIRSQRCYPIDRPWFRELMYHGIEDHVVFSKSFESYAIIGEPERQLVQVKFTDQTTAVGRLLVAADGVRSRVRRQMLPWLKQVDVDRTIIWGRTPLTDGLRSEMPNHSFDTHYAAVLDHKHPERLLLWAPIEWPKDILGLSNGALSHQDNYVFWAFTSEANRSILGDSASVGKTLEWVYEVTSEWAYGFQALFKRQDMPTLSARPCYSSIPNEIEWQTNPCVTFLGDAIHAMAPTRGVGGRTAIEDARDVCLAISAAFKDNLPSQAKMKDELSIYEGKMRARAKDSVEESFTAGKTLWAGQEWWEYTKYVDQTL